jgi:probable HAF family extracellular repeat protein
MILGRQQNDQDNGRLGLLGAALMLGGLAAAPAQAATEPAKVPAPKQLGTLGGKHSVAYDVNDRGQVVGQSTVDPNDNTSFHNFLWQRGVMKDIGTGFEVVDINNRGHIAVNTYFGGVTRAGIWRDGKVTDLGIAGQNSADAVNDNDEVVGSFRDADNNSHAFVWRRGVVTELPGTYAVARGINNKGVIVGAANIDGAQRGIVWRGGKLTDLGGPLQDAAAINDRGEIAANGRGASGWPHAFVWRNGTITELPALGGNPDWRDYTYAKAINDRGDVLGSAATPTTVESAVWRNGKVQVGLGGNARGMNNRGQLVGNTAELPNPPEFIFRAVIWG